MKYTLFFLLTLLTACNNMKSAEKNFRPGYADVNGLKMYYEIGGEGTPLVLIHGGGSTIQTTFGRIIDELAKTHQVLAVELQTHGHTSDRNAELSFEQDADDVAELMRQLNIPKADLFGFSNGGSTAMYLALRHPEQVGKVICASALLKRDGATPQFWDFMKNGSLQDMPRELKTAFMEIHNDSARLQVMHDKCVNRMLSMKDMTDEELKSIKAPVLMVGGDSDVPTREHLAQVSRLVPDCKLVILPGGHGDYMGEISSPRRDEKQFEFVPIVERFLK
jgi:pimeloyl-ACP methyl ester carboxylesterase